MANILFRTTPRILMGPGCADQIGPELKALKGKRVLIVTDPGIIQAGLLDRVQPSLKKAGVTVTLFDQVEPDPHIEIVDQALARLKEEKCDSVIGMGGGSSLDIAKLVAAMAVNPGHISDYFGVDLLGQTRTALDSRPHHRRDRQRSHPHRHSFGPGRAFEKRGGFQPSFPEAGPFGPYPDHSVYLRR